VFAVESVASKVLRFSPKIPDSLMARGNLLLVDDMIYYERPVWTLHSRFVREAAVGHAEGYFV